MELLARHEYSDEEMERNRIKFYERFKTVKKSESDQKNQQRCPRCKRIVGCDVNGRKHKCNCGK